MAGARHASLCPLRARQDRESRGLTVTHGDNDRPPDLGGSRSATLYPEPSKLVGVSILLHDLRPTSEPRPGQAAVRSLHEPAILQAPGQLIPHFALPCGTLWDRPAHGSPYTEMIDSIQWQLFNVASSSSGTQF